MGLPNGPRCAPLALVRRQSVLIGAFLALGAPLVLTACGVSDAAPTTIAADAGPEAAPTTAAVTTTAVSPAPAPATATPATLATAGATRAPARVEVHLETADGATSTVSLVDLATTSETAQTAGQGPVVFDDVAAGSYRVQVSSEGGGGPAGDGAVLGSALQVTRTEPFAAHDGDLVVVHCDATSCAVD